MPPKRGKRDVTSEEKPSKKAKPDTMVGGGHQSFYGRRPSKSSNNDYQESGSFSSKKCTSFFAEYASAEDPEMIGPDGIEAFCKDLGVAPEDPVMLVLAYKMDAKTMGYFTKKEWIKGLQDLQCDSIAKLRSKMDLIRSHLYDTTMFKNIYRYSFDFAKEKDQRSMDLPTAKAMLSLLLNLPARPWPLHPHFQQFLEESKYKVINKDQWCNILEFSRSVSPDLKNYDEDGAWPVLLDEFVDWVRKRRITAEPEIISID